MSSDQESKMKSVLSGVSALALGVIGLIGYYYFAFVQIENVAAQGMGTNPTNPQFQALMKVTGLNNIALTEGMAFVIHYCWISVVLALFVGFLTRWITKPQNF